MKNNDSVNIENLKNKFGKVFLSTQQELEELAVQFSLGKAEAADKFEEIKRDFHQRVQEWKNYFAGQKNQEQVAHFTALLEELNLQLNLGRAEAREYFEGQKQNILKSLDKFEAELKNDSRWNEFLSDLKSEGEKLRLKLEILQLKFELKKFRISDDFKSAMKEVGKEAEKVLDKAGQKWNESKSRYTDFNDEMSLVYKHLKKAIKSL
jgi:hypothetical protein